MERASNKDSIQITLAMITSKCEDSEYWVEMKVWSDSKKEE